MRKILLILGLAAAAVVCPLGAYYITSQVPPELQDLVQEAPAEPTTFDEMMESAANYREERHFDAAYGFIRLALDCADTPEQKVDAGYEMGSLMFDDFKNGGESDLESAAIYLQAAYSGAATPDKKYQVGRLLLDVLQSDEDKDLFMDYLDQMLSDSESSATKIELWQKKFEYLMAHGRRWHDVNDALASAELMPVQDESWYRMLEQIRLQAKEKLLTDDEWFSSYAEIMGFANPDVSRRKIFDEIRETLTGAYHAGDWKVQTDALIRLAQSYVAIGDYDKAHEYLEMFLDMEPTEKLYDALMLYSRISRVRGDVGNVAELAKSIIRRFNFDDHTRNEVVKVIRLLEEHGLYDDAMGLLDGCFSATAEIGIDDSIFLRRAAVLEERLGHRASALNHLAQLKELGADNQFDKTVTELIHLNMQKSNYESVENLVHLYINELLPKSTDFKNALFNLFEAKFWLDRPIVEQLFVGSIAVQNAPEDGRVASVELRMAEYIEDMNLDDLAISYYNRIGLLNFIKTDSSAASSSLNVGEQAMLGKARCLKNLEDWSAADHLYRELCTRTKSPMIKAEAALGWGELALKFNQRVEAERRFNLTYPQLLTEVDQVRYMLGKAKVSDAAGLGDPDRIDESVRLLEELPEDDQKAATIAFFNNTFDYLYDEDDEKGMLRLVDIASQSKLADWLPIQSYLLRVYENRFDHENIEGLSKVLREKDNVAGASIVELAQVADRVESLADGVAAYNKKAVK